MALAMTSTSAATAKTTKKEFGMPKVDDPPMPVMASGMPRMVVWPTASSSASPRQMLSVASVMMKGCGRRPKT